MRDDMMMLRDEIAGNQLGRRGPPPTDKPMTEIQASIMQLSEMMGALERSHEGILSAICRLRAPRPEQNETKAQERDKLIGPLPLESQLRELVGRLEYITNNSRYLVHSLDEIF